MGPAGPPASLRGSLQCPHSLRCPLGLEEHLEGDKVVGGWAFQAGGDPEAGLCHSWSVWCIAEEPGPCWGCGNRGPSSAGAWAGSRSQASSIFGSPLLARKLTSRPAKEEGRGECGLPSPFHRWGALRQARLEQGQAWSPGLSASPAASRRHLHSALSSFPLLSLSSLGPRVSTPLPCLRSLLCLVALLLHPPRAHGLSPAL